jgi:hypothetical protein
MMGLKTALLLFGFATFAHSDSRPTDAYFAPSDSIQETVTEEGV